MNEQEWLVDQEPESQQWLEDEGETTNYTTYAEGHKDKHKNNEVPIPAWPLFLIIPIVVYYAAWKHSRQR